MSISMEAPGTASYTLPQFCKRNGISLRHFYNLEKKGLAPRTMRLGDKCRRVSAQAELDWIAACEAGSVTAGEAA